MSKKLMLLLAGALAALAFAALPSVAAAGEWECETTAGAICGTFSGTNSTTTTLTVEGSAETVTCTANSVAGEYETKTTGKNATVTFTGCTGEGLECHSSGQANGVIKTFDLPFHNIMLEKTPTTPSLGLLLTPSANGEFATFQCGGAFGATIHVKGNGLVGEVTKTCASETPANTNITLDFDSVASGTQKWTQITTEGTKFDLLSVKTFFGTTERTASQDGSGSIKFASATKITCP